MKRILALFLILTMTIGLFGCAKAPEDVGTDDSDGPSTEQTEPEPEPEPEPITVAVCMGSISHPVHRIVQTGFMLKAEELGMNGVISGLDNGSIQELIAIWEGAVINGAKGVLVWTGDCSCYDMMKGMKQMGAYTVVPHFTHDYADTKEFIDKNVSCLARTYGAAAADYIVDALIEKGITTGSIATTHRAPCAAEWPANEAFIKRINELNTNFTALEKTNEGFELSNYIDVHPDMVAAFGTTGDSPQSWTEAMKVTGRTDLIVVGMDYTELNMELVENGPITAVVCQPLYEEAEVCAQALYDLNNGVVFNTSEDTWFEELEAPVADKDDMPHYRDIWQKMYDYFGEE